MLTHTGNDPLVLAWMDLSQNMDQIYLGVLLQLVPVKYGFIDKASVLKGSFNIWWQETWTNGYFIAGSTEFVMSSAKKNQSIGWQSDSS